jgi:glycosyltransferase involved in cell wall biosynthesis
MKQVLFVAYYFPPTAASGAMRPLGFSRHLESYGWRPTVLSTTPQCVYPAHAVDENLSTYVPDTVTVERVAYRDPLTSMIRIRNRIRAKIGARLNSRPAGANLTGSTGGAAGAGYKNRSAMKDAVLDWMFAFPDRQASWKSPAFDRIISTMGRKNIPDVVLATGAPWTNFVLGRELARRLGRPLVLDYRDPWTSNPYYSFGTKFLTGKTRRLERAICLFASRVITNTEELRDRLCEEYPQINGRCISIPNGFDLDVLGMARNSHGPTAQASVEADGKQQYELCHFGTVYGKRNPRALFQSIWELYEERLLRPGELRLRFVGAWETTDQACNSLAESLEKQGFLRREPPVSHEVCVRQMKEASVLLVVQPESPLQVPGKIYEYIALGRPLLLVGGEGATASLVDRYRLGLSCRNEVQSFKALVRRILTQNVRLDPPDAQSVSRFEYRRLTKDLADLLETVAAESHTSHKWPFL